MELAWNPIGRPSDDPVKGEPSRIELDSGLDAPARARAFVQARLQDSPKQLAADVALVTSELVANAVEAGASRLVVSAATVEEEFTVAVEDDAPGWPVMGPLDFESVRGRGLRIVDQLSDRWAVTRADGTKTVSAVWVVAASS